MFSVKHQTQIAQYEKPPHYEDSFSTPITDTGSYRLGAIIACLYNLLRELVRVLG